MSNKFVLTKLEAAQEYYKLLSNNFAFKNYQNLDPKIQNLRKRLCSFFKELQSGRYPYYKVDLLFGLELYKELNETYNLTKDYVLAANLGFWYQLTLLVIPDIVYARWGDNKIRYFASSNRIWLYTLWWYIHLSWQGSEELTKKTIEKFNTDTIVQIVERPGIGFEFELTRAIVKRLSVCNEYTQTLRNVMRLNTMYLKTIEPKLYVGGVKGYVDMLFSKVK